MEQWKTHRPRRDDVSLVKTFYRYLIWNGVFVQQRDTRSIRPDSADCAQLANVMSSQAGAKLRRRGNFCVYVHCAKVSGP